MKRIAKFDKAFSISSKNKSMSNEKYRKLSIAELNRKKSTLKNTALIMAGGLIVLFAISIWNTFKKGEFDWTMLMAFSLSIIVFTSFREAKKITNEIISRD
jgi:hypothetical protein